MSNMPMCFSYFGFSFLCLKEQNSESRCLIQSILGVLFSFLLHLIPCVHLYRLLWVGDLYKGKFFFFCVMFYFTGTFP
ncbi:uncharacterized protein ASPGLDRAFT_1423936 [Aspergillus glaucus CBS 516.65]|uniref:Uncharacterized protein n=1 Tax=Aspergillus glaucus CBS 516.65 TaxID=1160497 RepID=A0A1L9VML6_ASPGL|nr:hypothetical protein ASPGLDRAFT_1423936 [Aspergillus glaucus CBS 516.65]OJJ85163.1 hypothetical protein ASPGLDRAFT_1423936 [Aspergillus glaucus CBS 516.65]